MPEPKSKKEFKVLIICCGKCRQDPFTDRFTYILRNRFRSRFVFAENEKTLATACYNSMPDIVMLDPDCKKIIQRIKTGSGYLENLSKKPFIILVFPHIDEIEAHLLALPVEAVLSSSSSQKKISEVIAAVVKKRGFKVFTGKVKGRLVKRSVSITLTTQLLNCKIYGSTTGINKNGLGARVNAEGLTYHELKKLSGQKCRIKFNEPSLNFLPVEATVLRVEKSWSPKYDAFLAAAFDGGSGYGLDGASKNILRQLIDSQQDESVLKPPPEEDL